MRVLLVSQELPPTTPGGIGGYVASTARGLAARGHEVHVLSCVSGQARSDLVRDGVHEHRRGELRLPTGWASGRSATLCRLRAAASVRAALRGLLRDGLRPDVVEAPDWMAEGLLLPRSLPLVVTLHSGLRLVTRESGAALGPDGVLADRLEARAVRRADVVTSPSRLLADDVAATGWTDREVVVVPTAVELEAWPPAPAGPVPPRVLSVGRLEARKGVLVLLEAAARLREQVPGLELVWVGRDGDDAGYAAQVRRRAAALGPWVRLVDGVPRPELASWYAGARVVALPSRWDNFPMVALEAMACRRPVVCTRTTGTAPLLEQADVVPPGDPVALAAALRPHLLDPAHADAAGTRARLRVELLTEEALAGRERAYRRAAGLDRSEAVALG